MVTGGLGFIGSYFVELLLEKGHHVINIDNETYAKRNDLSFEKNPRYEYRKEDICNLRSLPEDIDYLVNFAAESHVDRSIDSGANFFHSNLQGVHNLLKLLRMTESNGRPIFIQISTDEVYGDIEEGYFNESSVLKPSNPYSATKAAAEELVLGWSRTYGIKSRITRSCNNYGYGQNAEKLIPKSIKRTSKGLKPLIHGDGSYKREWIYAKDNCEAIYAVMEKGQDGEIYNISTNEEYSNLEVVKMVLEAFGKEENFLEFVENRPGQDIRYAISSDKIRGLGWKPQVTLREYIPRYVSENYEKAVNIKKGYKHKVSDWFENIRNPFKK